MAEGRGRNGSYIRIFLPETFYSLISEKDVYYNRKQAMGILLNGHFGASSRSLITIGKVKEPYMITSYEYIGPSNDPWHFLSTQFDHINLLVGATGSGKTRFLNTLFNFASSVVKGSPFRSGKWILTASAEGNQYHWTYEGNYQDMVIERELLLLGNEKGKEEIIVDRTREEFKFLNNPLPRLQRNVSSVSLLKEEPIIQPLYRLFSHMERRSFHDVGLRDAVSLQGVSDEFIKKLTDTPDLELIWGEELPVSAKMYVLEECFPRLYKLAIEFFFQVFPLMKDAKFQFVKSPLTVGERIPMFTVKEKGVDRWIPISELSSGMQKVLLIVTDILTLPGESSIYLIDEYENSLGVNAIDFLPSFLLDHAGRNQFFITTHHPFLINNMPIRSWRVFIRKGSDVSVRQGQELEERFGKSKQKAFVQLINDPLFTEGVE
jgi:hypothetical protein